MDMCWNKLRPRSVRREKEGVILVCIALWSLLSYWAISRHVIESAQVQGASMAPTMQDGSRYLLVHFAPFMRRLRRGDIIALRRPGDDGVYVKRLIGLPGERIRMEAGRVLVNDLPLDEPYLPEGTVTLPGKLGAETQVLEPDHYFVLGDNRAFSEDSRAFGPVPRTWISGVVTHWRAVTWFARTTPDIPGEERSGRTAQ